MDVKETSQALLGQGFIENARDKSQLGKDDFMKLLLAQMQHQDPLSPTDSVGQIAQLAQLSSLEQLENINDNIATMSMVEAAGTNSQTVNYIGKTITAATDKISVSSTGKPAGEMSYELGSNANSVDITITDEFGNIVRTIKHNAKSMGKHEIEWDGLDDDGNPVKEGVYSFDIAAVDGDGSKVEAMTLVKGKVTGITYENGYPELIIGNVKITLGSVISVDETLDGESNSNILTPKVDLLKIDAEEGYTLKAIKSNFFNMKK